MPGSNDLFMWSDNWWIDHETIWFVAGEQNFLFQLDRVGNRCKFVAELPDDSENKFRLTPRCIKCGKEVFCLPDMGDSIWVYHVESRQFSRIKVNNPQKIRLSIVNFWEYENKIYAVSIGLRQILEINIRERKIDNYYNLCNTSDAAISLSTRVGTEIYTVSALSNRVYQFSMETKIVMSFELAGVKGGLRTISFDGHSFWLSGYRRELYIWEKECNSIKIVDQFPDGFGIYNFDGDNDGILDCKSIIYNTPVFMDSVAIGQSVWFIPFRTNKVIYADVDTHMLYALDIEGEKEDRQSMRSNYMKHKYIPECVIDSRYLIIFSLKSRNFFELDTINKHIKIKSYTLMNADEFLSHFHNIMLGEDSFTQRLFQMRICNQHKENKRKSDEKVGTIIHNQLIKMEK